MDEAATATNGGTTRAEDKLLVRATFAPVAPAGVAKVTVHVVVARMARFRLAQASELTEFCEPVTVNATDFVTPLRVAVTLGFWLDATVAAVTVNVALVAPDATRTEAGTVKADVMLLARATVAPLPPGAEERVTVQVVDADEASVVFAQASDDNEDVPGLWVRDRFVLALAPFRVPVTVAVWLVVKEPAVALNVAVEPPAGTVTVEGTVTLFVALRPTVVSADTAALNVAVQTAIPPGAREVGEQLIRLRRTPVAGVMVPPLVLTEAKVPVGSEASPPVTPIATDEDPGAKVMAACATTPFEMPRAFMPLAKHT